MTTNANVPDLYRLCSVEGCSRLHSARGYCSRHYKLWERNGVPEVRRPVDCSMRRCYRKDSRDAPSGVCRDCRVQLESGVAGSPSTCRIISCHEPAHATLDGRPYCDAHFRWFPEQMEPEMVDGTMLAPFGLVDISPVQSWFSLAGSVA